MSTTNSPEASTIKDTNPNDTCGTIKKQTNKKQKKKLFQSKSCNLCTEYDNEEMVKCDECPKWYHFECVNETASVSKREWICTDCKDSKAQEKSKTPSQKSNSSKYRAALELEKLNEEKAIRKKLREREFEEEMALLKKKFEILNENNESMDEDDSTRKSSKINRKIKTWIKEQEQTMPHMFENKNNDQTKQNQNDPNLNRIIANCAPLRELPSFNGDFSEWPIFYNTYITSTQKYGYSNDENLLRLRNALKEPARGCVKGYLLIPATVPELIETLKKKYGRPEFIIDDYIEKIRRKPDILPDRYDLFIEFSHDIHNMCATIRSCGMYDYLRDARLLQQMVSKLPPNYTIPWATYQMTCNGANLEIFEEWLGSLAESLYTVNHKTGKQKREEPQQRIIKSFPRKQFQASQFEKNNNTTIKNDTNTCSAGCEENHQLPNCPVFNKFNKQQRWLLVKEKELCKCCLNSHYYSKCTHKRNCNIGGCEYKHHPLLHNHNKEKQPETETATVGYQLSQQSVLFRIIPITLYNQHIEIKTYAFLDEGSSVTLLEEDLANKLHLDGNESQLCLKWTGDTTRMETSRKVTVQISGTYQNAPKFLLKDTRTINILNLPTQTISSDLITKNKHLQGVPIELYNNAKPQLLIGMDNWNICVPRRIREGVWGTPVATKTKLGWTVYCQSNSNSTTYINQHFHICECMCFDNLQKELREFMITEDFGIKSSPAKLQSKEDQRALEILHDTTKHIGNTYETGLLWKQDKNNPPDSLNMARTRHKCLMKKLNKDEDLKKQFNVIMKQHLEKGYIRKLTHAEKLIKPSWYLPVFAIKHHDKNKIRIVFDAAAQVEGTSLNTMLLKGPDLLEPLTEILWRFREKTIAVTGDIQEMFHRIKIIKPDQNFQRFLWAIDDKEEPEEYIMEVMTFGATCSPCSAHYTVNSIKRHHYVDDWLQSFDDIEKAIETIQNVQVIHNHAGFQIHSWQSNSNEVLNNIEVQNTNSTKNLNIQQNKTSKVLGMKWDAQDDVFFYSLNERQIPITILNGTVKPTKREILRILMTIFDPLGLISFILIQIKLILQDIWRSSVQWDEEIKQKDFETWKSIIKMLPDITTLRIPRCYVTQNLNDRTEKVELHIFVDASASAYAAVAYIRIPQPDSITCTLIGGKTKIGPQKPISIPRMELQAAVLGVRYANSIQKGHSLKFTNKYFWSDSQTVLSWLRADHRKYKQFVALRIGEILEKSDPSEWRWVSSKSNPADDATKPKTINTSVDSRWFKGPEFLNKLEDFWPEHSSDFIETDEEMKNLYHQQHHEISKLHTEIPVTNYSKWIKVIKIQAFILRFINNCRSKNIKMKGPIIKNEFEQAEKTILRQTQWESYKDEIYDLQVKNNVSRTSKIYVFSPFLGEDNLIRSHGRLQQSDLNYNTKNPIIMPKDHHITRLMIEYYHENYYHQNNEVIVNEIRQKFCIPHLRTTVKKLQKNCQRCKNVRATPSPPLMAPLPKERMAIYNLPFSYVGIDYFGPFDVSNKRSIEKRYGVIFTCLTTRASHIELANSLTTNSCILCIRNFINRRGTPIAIITDNGTNFQGAKRKLEEGLGKLKNIFNDDNIKNEFFKIDWKFIPPAAPHMGGCWERLIRIVKQNLEYVVTTKTPNEEELRSGLIEIENILNSRPLTYIPLEINQTEAITPNHFLLGSSNGTKPIFPFSDDREVLRDTLRVSQQMADKFWRRFVKEYLPTLNFRSKWREKGQNIVLGDVVLIVNENHRNSWKMGTVVKITPSRDGIIREVTVKTDVGEYRRPVTKIAVLDVKSKLPTGVAYQGGEM